MVTVETSEGIGWPSSSSGQGQDSPERPTKEDLQADKALQYSAGLSLGGRSGSPPAP